MHDYGQIEGFYRVSGAKYSFLLIATDASYKIKNGDPLAFDCDVSGRPRGRMSCTAGFPLMENVGIALTYIDASQSALPELRAFYKAVLRMVKRWQVKNDYEEKIKNTHDGMQLK